MGYAELVGWGEGMHEIASSLVRTVHALNEMDRTPALEQLQRNLCELSCLCSHMGDKMIAAGQQSTNGTGMPR